MAPLGMSLTTTIALLFGSARVAAADLDAVLCRGLWSPDASEASLRRHFGVAQARWQPIDVGEGEKEEGTVAFPGDVTQRIEVFWKDAAARQRPARLVIH